MKQLRKKLNKSENNKQNMNKTNQKLRKLNKLEIDFMDKRIMSKQLNNIKKQSIMIEIMLLFIEIWLHVI